MNHAERARKAIDTMAERIEDLEDKVEDLEEELRSTGSGSDLAEAVRAYFDWMEITVVRQTNTVSEETKREVLNHHLKTINEQLQTFQA